MHGGSREGMAEDLSARALRAWLDFAEEAAAPAGRGTPEGAAAPADPADAEVDAVLAEFGGDVRAALRALLHDIAVLAGDFATAVSRGYVRGARTGRGRPGAVGRSRVT